MGAQRTGAAAAPPESSMRRRAIRLCLSRRRLCLGRLCRFLFLTLLLGQEVELIFGRARACLEHAADLLTLGQAFGHGRERRGGSEHVDRRLATAAHRADSRAAVIGKGLVGIVRAHGVAPLLEAPRSEYVRV